MHAQQQCRLIPQLQPEAVVALGEVLADDHTKSPQYAVAALLAALADGLCGPHSGSSSSTTDQGRLSQVSHEVVLELTATLPVLLHLVAYFIRERDVEDVYEAIYTVYINQMIATASKLTALAHYVAVYSSSIQPAGASTAQLLQCNAALDEIQQEVATLADVLQYEGPWIGSSAAAVETATAVCSADWPDFESRQLFSLLVQRLATQQQQPAAGLVTAVAAGLAAHCCSPFDVSQNDIHAAAQALAGVCLPDVGLSKHELADLLDAADVLCEGTEDDNTLQSLVAQWKEELPRLLHCNESDDEQPVVL